MSLNFHQSLQQTPEQHSSKAYNFNNFLRSSNACCYSSLCLILFVILLRRESYLIPLLQVDELAAVGESRVTRVVDELVRVLHGAGSLPDQSVGDGSCGLVLIGEERLRGFSEPA